MDTLSYIKYKIKKVHQEGGFYESINYYIIISVICSGDVCVRENSARSYINDRVLRSGRYWSLDIQEAFTGFIDSNVILFVAMFIVGGALFETGMANKIGGVVTKFAKSERMLIVTIMVIAGDL